MNPYECMICGSREQVLRGGGLQLCARCVEALGQALEGKLGRASDGEAAADKGLAGAAKGPHRP